MQPTRRILGLVILALLASTPSSANWPACGSDVGEAFAAFSEQVRSGREAMTLADAPSLQGCNPSSLLKGALAEGLSKTVLEVVASGQPEQGVWMADILERVRTTFEAAGHSGDYHEVSTQIFEAVSPELSDLSPPPENRKDEFSGLDALIQALRALPDTDSPAVASGADGIEPPETPGTTLPPTTEAATVAAQSGETPTTENSSTSDITDSDTPQDDAGSSWLLGIGLIALGAALAIAVFLIMTWKRNKSVGFHDGTQAAHPRTDSRRPLSADRDPMPSASSRSLDPTNASEVISQLSQLKRQIEQMPASSTHEDVIDSYRNLRRDHELAVEGIAKDLEKVNTDLTTLHQGIVGVRGKQTALEAKVDQLLSKINALHTATQELRKTPTPLEAQFQTELALLKEDWKRFLTTEREIGQLAQSAAAKGDHKVIFDELLRELPRAVESDPQLSRFFDSKLASVHFLNQQLKQIRLVGTRAEQSMPDGEDAQMRKLLGLRDSAHLLATFRSTEQAGAELLRFKPAEWCQKKLPELADQFLCHYQIAQAQGQSQPLDKALEVVVRALRIGELKPIEIVLGQTDFDSEIHVGVSTENKTEHTNGTIVGVVKNGFKNIRDGRIAIRPEVIVNRH